jgi:hypothetical protein
MVMHRRLPGVVRSQQGVSTLVVAVILLIAATFLTFFAAKIGMQEQRMSGNDYRQKKTFALAEAGLDRAKAWLAGNRQDFATWGWTACAGTETTPPCGNGSANQYGTNWSWISVYRQSAGSALAGLTWPQSTQDGPFILTQSVPAAINIKTSFNPVVLISQARSDDQTGRAVVRQSMTRFLIAQGGPVPPLMASTVVLKGNFTVVGNPDPQLNILDPTSGVNQSNCDYGGHDSSGHAQLFSIWTPMGVTLIGSPQTCYPGSFLDKNGNRCVAQNNTDPVTGGTISTFKQCNCQSDPAYPSPYSTAASLNDDVVQNDPNFPGDIFLYIFGRTRAAVKAEAQSLGRVLADCSKLNTLQQNATGLYWVTGACKLNSNVVIGQQATPVILVFETSLSAAGDADFWGLAMGVDMGRTLVSSPTGLPPYYSWSDFTASTPPSVASHGTFTIHGALATEGGADSNGGTYNLVYDPCVFAGMGIGSGFDQYGPVQGSWNDTP